MGVAKSMTLRGGGGPTLSVTMTLIFPKIVWTCPLTPSESLKNYITRRMLTKFLSIGSYPPEVRGFVLL